MGEIVLRPKVPCTFMLGYHNNESGTLRVLRDLWLHTGDLGFLDDDGYLYFRGREAHWLRRRGENISAYELESIISQYPGLKEIAVVGVPSEIGEEDVKLFVVPESSTAFDPAAARALVRRTHGGVQGPALHRASAGAAALDRQAGGRTPYSARHE